MMGTRRSVVSGSSALPRAVWSLMATPPSCARSPWSAGICRRAEFFHVASLPRYEKSLRTPVDHLREMLYDAV